MTLIDPLPRAERLKSEANQLLAHLGLEEMLRSTSGRVEYTGSYLLDLMAYPDIDVMAAALSAAGAQAGREPAGV
jgi:hypothetical protein